LFSHTSAQYPDGRNLDRLLAALANPGAIIQSVFDAIASKAANMKFNTNSQYGATIQDYYDKSIAPWKGCF